ncbi:MAG: RDD family protein [Bacillota bacterium]|nr:RDD family protein [Bacillota bacterium]
MQSSEGKVWFYIKKGQQQGPIGVFELQKLFEQGILSGETYLWSKDMKCWQMAKILEPFCCYCTEPTVNHEAHLSTLQEYTFPKGRPLVRFIARMFDLSIFTLFFVTFISIFSPELITHSSKILLFILNLVIWVFMEPIILTIFGNTPGKALLNTKIRTVNGEFIDFFTAFKRSIFIIAAGMGFGIPILNFFTFLFSYFDLKGNGISTWDHKNGTIVLYGKIDCSRVLIASALPLTILMVGVMI